jgi:hypothetical protein
MKKYISSLCLSILIGSLVLLAHSAKAETLPLSVPIPNVSNPGTATDAVYNFNHYLTTAYTFSIILAAFFAIVFIVYSAVQYIISRGDTSKISEAKDRITSAVYGLLLLIGAALILKTINPALVTLSDISVPNKLPTSLSIYSPTRIRSGALTAIMSTSEETQLEIKDRLNRIYTALGRPRSLYLEGDVFDKMYKGEEYIYDNRYLDIYYAKFKSVFSEVADEMGKHDLDHEKLNKLRVSKIEVSGDDATMEQFISGKRAEAALTMAVAYTESYIPDSWWDDFIDIATVSVVALISPSSNGFLKRDNIFNTASGFESFITNTRTLAVKIQDELDRTAAYNHIVDLEAYSRGDKYVFCYYKTLGTSYRLILTRMAGGKVPGRSGSAGQVPLDDYNYYRNIEVQALNEYNSLSPTQQAQYCTST